MNPVFSKYAALVLAVALATTSCSDDDNTMTNPVGNTGPDVDFVGLTRTNAIVGINASTPGTVDWTTPVTGLQAGDNLIAIDYRPQTGQLIGLGSSSRLYVINPNSGVATALGTASFTPAISGDHVGFDFNPTVDRIRLVTSSGQNLRLNPETGAVAATDGNLNPGTPQVTAAAYTNSYAGTTSTELFVLDFASGQLFKQSPPNDGTLVAVGTLDVDLMTADDAAFDISADNATSLVSLSDGMESKLYTANLTTGKLMDVGEIGADLIGLAIPTTPVGYAVDASNNLHIFDFTNPGTPLAKAVTGLMTDEQLIGIDMRPATGQLFALGNTGQLYTVNVSTGAATAIGSPLPLSKTNSALISTQP